MLNPYWKTLEDEKKEFDITYLRRMSLRSDILAKFPEDVDGEITVDDMGLTLTRCFIYLKKDASVKDTTKARRFLNKMFGKSERDFREREGTFMWKGKRKTEDAHGEYEIIVMVENANEPNCKIKKVTKTIEVYESDCKKEK